MIRCKILFLTILAMTHLPLTCASAGEGSIKTFDQNDPTDTARPFSATEQILEQQRSTQSSPLQLLRRGLTGDEGSRIYETPLPSRGIGADSGPTSTGRVISPQ